MAKQHEVSAEITDGIKAAYSKGASVEDIADAYDIPYAMVEAVLIDTGLLQTEEIATAEDNNEDAITQQELSTRQAAQDVADIREILRRSKRTAANRLVELMDSEEDGVALSAVKTLIRELSGRDDEQTNTGAKASLMAEMNKIMKASLETYKNTLPKDEPIQSVTNSDGAIDITAEEVI